MTEITEAARIQALEAQNAFLTESIADMMMRIEDIGWEKLMGEVETYGPTLDSLKQLTKTTRDMAAGNPLMKRGAQLRHAYTFGRGVVFSGEKPAARDIIDDPYNAEALFSVTAYESMNLSAFTDGNFFTIYDDSDKTFINVPLEQITGVVTDPRDASKIRYLQRTWTANGKEEREWFPLNKYKAKVGNKIDKTISAGPGAPAVPVNQRSVIFHKHTNRQTGWTFGVPDSFAAILWVKAYSEYLKDNKMLVKALAQFAWKVTQPNKAGVANAAVKVAVPGVAGTAALGPGADLAALPRAGSDVNFNNGQPLAAMIASSLGVSVIALLSSPGAAGGSYGAAQTLDFPTIRVMEAVQDSWVMFFTEVLRWLKSPNAEVAFPSIETDAVYREIQSAAQAHSTGALFQEEYRQFVLDRMDIANPKAGLPEPNGFNTWKDPAAQPAGGAVGDPIPRQGNTGSVGNNASDISDHSGDND
jgi:hypothetical protein